jgi:hypothetical protein
MTLVQKTVVLIFGFSLTIGLSPVAYSDATKIAELSDSINTNLAARNWDAVGENYEEIYAVYQSDHGEVSSQAGDGESVGAMENSGL